MSQYPPQLIMLPLIDVSHPIAILFHFHIPREAWKYLCPLL